MQQTTTILGTAQTAQSPADALIERLETIAHSVKLWLDDYSPWASRVIEQPITNRGVLRIWAIALCLMLVAFSVASSPLMSIASLSAMAWLVYRLRQAEPKTNGKKGGKP